MEEFRSFFKDKGLNQEVLADNYTDPPKIEKVASLRKKVGADRYRDKARQLEYQKVWIMAKRRRLSEKG